MTTTLPLLALVVLLSASLQGADVVRLQVTVVVTVVTNGVAASVVTAATNTAGESVPANAPSNRSPFGFAETQAASGGNNATSTTIAYRTNESLTVANATNFDATAYLRLLKARRTPAPMPPTPFMARAGVIERVPANPAHLQARIEAMATASSRSAARTNLPLPMARSADGRLRRNE